jgi:hypothetical protein
MEEKKRRFVPHHLTERVLARFRRMAPGDIVPWEELSRLIGLNAQEEGRHYITSACNIILNREQIVIEGVVGLGMKRLTEQEMAALAPREIRRINRRARKAKRKMVCLKSYASLTPEQQLAYMTGLARLGYLEETTHHRERQERKIGNHEPPPRMRE